MATPTVCNPGIRRGVGWVGRACIAATLLGFAAAATPAANDLKTVDELVRQLGAADFATRETATKELMKREDAEERVKAAVRSPNPEVSRRASEVLASYEAKKASLHLKRMEKIAAVGYYDLLAECCAKWGTKPNGEGAWRVLEGAMTPLLFDAEERSLLGPRPNLFDPSHKPKIVSIDTALNASSVCDSRLIVRRPAKIFTLDFSTVIVESEQFTLTGLGRSLVFSNRDLDLRHHVNKASTIAHSVIICDGTVTVDKIRSCTIIAMDSCKFSAGKSKLDSCVVLGARDGVIVPDDSDRTGERGAFAAKLKDRKLFFDTDAVGFLTAMKSGELVVTKIESKSPFETAGLRLGDRVVAVDEAPILSKLELRKRIRGATAAGRGTVKVTRGGKTEIVMVNLMAWPS